MTSFLQKKIRERVAAAKYIIQLAQRTEQSKQLTDCTNSKFCSNKGKKGQHFDSWSNKTNNFILGGLIDLPIQDNTLSQVRLYDPAYINTVIINGIFIYNLSWTRLKQSSRRPCLLRKSLQLCSYKFIFICRFSKKVCIWQMWATSPVDHVPVMLRNGKWNCKKM